MAYPSKPERNKELVKKIELGWSYSKVGEYFNISKPAVHEIYHRWSPFYGEGNSSVRGYPQKVLDKR